MKKAITIGIMIFAAPLLYLGTIMIWSALGGEQGKADWYTYLFLFAIVAHLVLSVWAMSRLPQLNRKSHQALLGLFVLAAFVVSLGLLWFGLIAGACIVEDSCL